MEREEKEERQRKIGTVKGTTGRPPVADRPSDLWRQYLPPERRESVASLASYIGGLNIILRRGSHVSLAKITPEAAPHARVCVTDSTKKFNTREALITSRSGDDRACRKRTRNPTSLSSKCIPSRNLYAARYLVVIHFLFISNGRSVRATRATYIRNTYDIHGQRAMRARISRFLLRETRSIGHVT